MTVSAPTSATHALPAEQVQKIQRAAQDFETMALNQLLTPIFETVDGSKGPFGGGPGEAAWKPMMVSEMAKAMSQQGGLGLAQPIMQQMLRMQEAAQAGQDVSP